MYLATCEVFLFSGIKIWLNLRRFDSIELIQSKSQEVIKTLMQSIFQQCFRSWKFRWNGSISVDGNYFIGDGSE
jgi:hypothetical protein